MFAHQVIEDLKRNEDGNEKIFSFWVHYCRKLLESAQCFHMGEVSDVHQMFEAQDGQKLFIENAKYIKLPYEKCWFDAKSTKGDPCDGAEVESTKEGILAAKVIRGSDEFLIAFIVSYLDSIKMWVLIPVAYIISVGKDFTQESLDYLSEVLDVKMGKCEGGGNMKAIQLMNNIPPGEFEKLHPTCQLNLQLLCNSLLLLNCKNITTETHEPPAALNKARRKKGKQELFTYKTLKLIVPQDKKGPHPKGDPSLDHNRIHFCRGHFKEYTVEAPLFGRIIGLWWWQAHVRGKNRDGIVMKDYKVETKNE